MEQSYERTGALVRRADGPLASHFGAYVTSLMRDQYKIDYVYIKARRVLAFDRWLDRHGVALCDLDQRHISEYQSRRSRLGRSRCIETQHRESCALGQLLNFLRQQGVCTLPSNAVPADRIVSEFDHYLRHERGLASVTIRRITAIVRRFLADRFASRQIDLGALRARDVIEFVQRQSKRMQPCSMKNVVVALRSFLHYAQYRGEINAKLVASVPSVAAWSTTPQLPKAISSEHAQRAIDSCDAGTAAGRRDRAVLLLLARLGLRNCEIINLRLDDIDWDNGQLRVPGKGMRDCLLPLPADVGEAIVAYIELGRPTSEDRHLFLCTNAPIRALKEGSGATGSIVREALRRAKVQAPHQGSHQFRHALAVGMLKSGASLAEIGEVLRHGSPESTSIYAKVDVEALRTLALPWPGGAR